MKKHSKINQKEKKDNKPKKNNIKHERHTKEAKKYMEERFSNDCSYMGWE